MGQVTSGLGQVNLFLTCPTGQVDLKVNVKPCRDEDLGIYVFETDHMMIEIYQISIL